MASITITPANVSDIAEMRKLIREENEVMYGDAGYVGIEKRYEITGDEHLSNGNQSVELDMFRY